MHKLKKKIPKVNSTEEVSLRIYAYIFSQAEHIMYKSKSPKSIKQYVNRITHLTATQKICIFTKLAKENLQKHLTKYCIGDIITKL